MKGLRVLCIDDSMFIRSLLSKLFIADPDIAEVKTANDGASAFLLLATWRPDIITLDVEMPRMNGLEVLKVIKERWDVPVVMLSSLTRAGADITIKALEVGAVDWVQKPENVFDTAAFERMTNDLVHKIKTIAQLMDTRKSSEPMQLLKQSKAIGLDRDYITNDHFKRLVMESKWEPRGTTNLGFYLVAVGISTGGPSALNQVIPHLSKDMNAAMIIVQHMPATFTKVLADRLNSFSLITVKEAEDGETITKGFVYIVPGDKHIRLVEAGSTTLKIKLDQYPKIGGFRPSAESLFYFAAETCKERSVGVIMTGMGSDGSDNIAMIKKYSGKTIAQDEASCVIFGMPHVAIQKGNVDFVVPLNKIVDKINEFIIR